MLEFALKQERQRYYHLKTGENLDLGDNGSQGESEPSSISGSDSEEDLVVVDDNDYGYDESYDANGGGYDGDDGNDGWW